MPKVFEAVATALLPGLTLGLFAWTLLEALPTIPSPFIDAEVLPWFLVTWAIPVVIVGAPSTALTLWCRRASRTAHLDRLPRR